MRIRRSVPTLVPVLILACSAGCSKEKMADVFQRGVDEVEQSIAETTELVKQQAGLAGQFELVLDGPVSTQACYASLVSFSSGRPSVLQLSPGDEAGGESFPAAFLRAEVPAGTFAELVGKSLKGELYVQTAPDGPVWHSPEGQPVEITITNTADASVEGQLVRGTVVSTETGQSVSVTGKFQAVLR